MRETTIVSGNYPLRAYDEDGKIFGAEAIPEYINIYADDFNPNSNFAIPDERFAILFEGIVGQGATARRPADYLMLKSGSPNVITWAYEVFQKADYHQASGTFSLKLPPLIMARSEQLGFETNLTGISIVLYGKKVHLNEANSYSV